MFPAVTGAPTASAAALSSLSPIELMRSGAFNTDGPPTPCSPTVHLDGTEIGADWARTNMMSRASELSRASRRSR